MSIPAPLGIAGVGLIGGSIALRARQAGVRVVGFDPDPASASLVDAVAASLEELGAEAETLVLAMPIGATLEAIERLRRSPRLKSRLVLDVASVKAPIAATAAGWERFAATHPLAGAERGGAGAARADLFAGRTWAYVPAGDARDAAVCAFVAAMGAEPFAIDALAHDRAVAWTSHLPQVLVSTLAAALAAEAPPAELAGPGLASTLRLAGSPWPLWEAIVRANAPALARALREMGTRLRAVAEDLEAGDVARLASYFEDARASYDRFVRAPRD